MEGWIFLSGGENQVEAAEQDEDAADFFKDDSPFGFLVPVHITLDKLGARAGENNRSAVSDDINEQEGHAIE